MGKTYSTGLIVSPAEIQHNMAMFVAMAKLLRAVEHPSSFDWRSIEGEDFTTPIRDQLTFCTRPEEFIREMNKLSLSFQCFHDESLTAFTEKLNEFLMHHVIFAKAFDTGSVGR